MLLYVLALMFALTALFEWQTSDDRFYQDNGERAAAARMMGHHGAVVAMCSYPYGMQPQNPADNVYDPQNHDVVTNFQHATVNSPYPLPGCEWNQAEGDAVLAPATDNVVGAGAAYATTQQGEWDGYVTIIQSNYVITIASTAADASGEASQDTGLSTTRIGADLVNAVYAARNLNASMIGTYEKSSGKIRMNTSAGAFLALPDDPAQIGIVLSLDTVTKKLTGGVPNGAPVIATYLPAVTSTGTSGTAGTSGTTPPPFTPQL